MKHKRAQHSRVRTQSNLSRIPANAELKVLRKLVELTTTSGFPIPCDLFRALRSNKLMDVMEAAASLGIQKYKPREDDDGDSLAVRHLISSFLKKHEIPNSESDLRAEALRIVKECEDHNSWFNTKGYKRLYSDGELDPLVDRARAVCSMICGTPDWDDMFLDCRHGPGSSTSHTFTEGSSYFKYEKLPYRVSSRGIGLATAVIKSDQRWMSYLETHYREVNGLKAWNIIDWSSFWDFVFEVQEDNKITTVPKDVYKDRPIAIENQMNIYLQLGVEGYLRRRLKRWGVDLNSQKLNQLLAIEGSTSRTDVLRPATIDLASASDTISLRICKIILPPWLYTLLGDLRAHAGRLPDGTRLRYSRMSSMGNGATFALESLVFFSLAFAATERYLGNVPRGSVAVFGDDIIVPEPVADSLVHILEACGFRVNNAKSFTGGPFKESCGFDCFKGRVITPVYCRRPLRTDSDIYSLRNRLHRWFSLNLPEVDFQPLDDLMLPWCQRRLYGPYSDDEMDTYIHWPTPVRGGFLDNGSMFIFRCYSHTVQEIRPKSKNIHLRKLMHDLRPYRRIPYTQDFSGGGSRFAVYASRKICTRVVSRRTSHWQCEYRA